MQPLGVLVRRWHQLTRTLVGCLLLMGCGRTELVSFAPLDAGVIERCAAGFADVDGGCVEIAASLDGLRWELPCLTLDPDFPDFICMTGPDVTQSRKLLGVPGRLYDVRVRVRGVVETRGYVGGMTVAPFVVRGAEANPSTSDPWNVYRLEVSFPPAHWYLNAGASGEYVCHAVDTTFTVQVRAGATVVLFASSVDGRRSQIRNRDDGGVPLVAPEVAPAPAAFDGQFLQLDVLSVSAL
ncbi:MAG: hypothetical protein GQE15_19700 [Archangiaceae bacterium]|nr:hypothetical protein [Archangiaceae bacterium]